MQRDLGKMSEQLWDLLIIGGGITGAAIARDAALRGLRVALVEKGDFSSGTSSATSKLVHGGLRYLKTGEFSLVRESLRERRYLEMIAPHGVYPLPFLLPIYRHKALLYLGMWVYELFSYDKATLDDPSKRLASFHMLSAKQALAVEPGLDPRGLKGAAIYYDCQNVYPDRIALEFIRDAVHAGAMAANYVRASRLLVDNGVVQGAEVEDLELPHKSYRIRAKIVVNASGPWTDLVLSENQLTLSHDMRRSKGIHLVTRQLTRCNALVLETKKTKRVFFVLPWRGYSIVGTTDTDYAGDPDHVRVTEKDRDDLLQELNDAYPSAHVSKDDVLYSYVGIRPLIDEHGKASTQISRKSELYDHEKGATPLKGILTVLGGKWTTSRQLADDVVTRVYQKLALPPVPCPTIQPLSVARFGSFSRYLQEELQSWQECNQQVKIGQGVGSDSIPLALIQTLIELYGTRYREVYGYGATAAAYARGDHEIFSVGEQAYLVGQVVDAVRNEMALHLDDFLRRRTGIGTLGDPGRERVAAICRRMAQELGWDPKREREEIAAYYRSFSILP